MKTGAGATNSIVTGSAAPLPFAAPGGGAPAGREAGDERGGDGDAVILALPNAGPSTVAGAPDGGRADFDALFRSTYPRLVRALSVAADREAAADAVQDAFVQANAHWRRVGQLDNPGAWVRRVAINRLANQRRGRRRRDAAVARLDATERTASLAPADLDLAAAVQTLPEKQRLVICLHYLADLAVADIADTLGVAEGTVKSNLHDARLALRGHLGARPDA